MKILILGIGNEIRRDDSVGLLAARKASQQFEKEKIDVKEASSGGLPLLSKIQGYDLCYIIDSIMTKDGTPGDWYYLTLDDFKAEENRIVSHSVDLRTMKEIGKEMGEKIPEIKIFAIEVKEPFEFGDDLTKQMKEALPEVISEITEAIRTEIRSE